MLVFINYDYGTLIVRLYWNNTAEWLLLN